MYLKEIFVTNSIILVQTKRQEPDDQKLTKVRASSAFTCLKPPPPLCLPSKFTYMQIFLMHSVYNKRSDQNVHKS